MHLCCKIKPEVISWHVEIAIIEALLYSSISSGGSSSSSSSSSSSKFKPAHDKTNTTTFALNRSSNGNYRGIDL